MATTTFEEKKATRELVEMCRVYLCENFHKFSDANKIKISLAIMNKAIPLEISGGIEHTVFYQSIIEKPAINRVEQFASNN